MNSKDLRAIAHVERLTKMGVHSLKIEGRTKSFLLLRPYRTGLPAHRRSAAAGVKPFPTLRCWNVEGLAHRGYTEGFPASPYARRLPELRVRVPVSERQQFVGEFTGERKGQLAAVAVKNKFSVGDSLS